MRLLRTNLNFGGPGGKLRSICLVQQEIFTTREWAGYSCGKLLALEWRVIFITRLKAVIKAVLQLLTPFINYDGRLADDTVHQDDDSGQGAQS